MSWKKVKLGEVIKQRKGFIHIDNDVEYKLCRVRVHRQGVVLRENLKGFQINTKKQQVCKSGDFIVAEMDAKVGGYGFIPQDLDGAIVSSHYFLFELDINKIRPQFLEVVSQLKILQEQIKAVGSTNYAAIRPANVLEWEIPFPPIEKQIEIEKIFENAKLNIDKLNLQYQFQLTQLENLNQAILQEAVQGKLVPQNPNDEPASELLKRIASTTLSTGKATLRQAQGAKKIKELPPIKPEEIPFEIPESWVWCRLGEIIQYTENLDIQKHLSPETIVNYVDIDAIDNQNYIIREAKQKPVRELSTRARRVLRPNYIAYSTVRPYLKNIAIIEDELENYIGSTGFNVFKSLEVELRYTFYYLLTPYVNNSFKDLMVGFNSPSITNDQFEKSLFPLPPLSEQKRIVAEIERQFAKTKQLKEHIIANRQATEQLLKALLHGAFEHADAAVQAGEVEEKEKNTDFAMAAEKEEKYKKNERTKY